MKSNDKLGSAFRVLENPYRRQLLVAMTEENAQADADRDPLNVVAPADEPDVLETKLVHQHLPMLEEQGYIEWDRENHTVSKGPNCVDIVPLLELIDKHRDELPDGWL